MRSILMTSICMFIGVCVQAQHLPLLRGILSGRDVRKVNQYIASNAELYAYDYPETGMYWRQYREVLPGYYEGTMQVFYAAPQGSSGTYVVYPYRINVLVNDSTIFYFNFLGLDSQGRYSISHEVDTLWELYDQFISAFESFYHQPLDTRFLFVDSINYGVVCGQDSVTPPEMVKALECVDRRDTACLNRWLRCGNTELQLFAVQGFMLLQQKQVKLTADWLRLIHAVLDKKGNVNICTSTRERISAIHMLKSDFRFEQQE